MRASPSQSALRRDSYVARTCSGYSGFSFIVTVAAIWIGWNVP